MLEIVKGGELFDLLADRAPNGVLNYQDAAFYTACVVAAFNHFWEKDIIYRDLKPGEYFKRRSEHREWSTVDNISMTPLTFIPVSLS